MHGAHSVLIVGCIHRLSWFNLLCGIGIIRNGRLFRLSGGTGWKPSALHDEPHAACEES